MNGLDSTMGSRHLPSQMLFLNQEGSEKLFSFISLSNLHGYKLMRYHAKFQNFFPMLFTRWTVKLTFSHWNTVEY
jgi:hypothetical protein